MKSAEEIIKERIPNGIVNVKAEGGGNGKPQYAAEIEVIKKCMEEYASQFKTQSVTNEGASTSTLEELEKLVEKEIILYDDNSPHGLAQVQYAKKLWKFLKPHLSVLLINEVTKAVTDFNKEAIAKIKELQSQLKEKDETIRKVSWIGEGLETQVKELQSQLNEQLENVVILRDMYSKAQSQLTNSREEAIGFAVWMRDNEALVIAENEKTIGWEEMTYDWFYSLYLQSKTEQNKQNV